MILVDTSVWIRALARREPYLSELDRLLVLDQVAGHELIFGELLIGDREGRRNFLSDYERMHRVEMVSHTEVVAFVRSRRLHGRGAGWIDIHLIASAMAGRMKLWTADSRCADLAGELGASYEIPAA
ncbi:MAG: PIN domain-containing protein [Acidobacteriota bacterium]